LEGSKNSNQQALATALGNPYEPDSNPEVNFVAKYEKLLLHSDGTFRLEIGDGILVLS